MQRFSARPQSGTADEMLSPCLVEPLMHSKIYLAIGSAAIGATLIYGTPELSIMVFGVALAIALFGVPHGGLDHWTGRRLLNDRFASGWWAVFFPAYLFVAGTFAAGWFVMPTLTVILFFLISAWHFGREDQHAGGLSTTGVRQNHLMNHVTAMAVGGLVIWIPAVARPDEMRGLLRLIVPTGDIETTSRIVNTTQAIALCMLPISALAIVTRVYESPRDVDRWVPVATAAMAIAIPILLSFAIYFCGWHSWQGLQRMRREEGLSARSFIRAVVPLSVAAILGVVATGWWMLGDAMHSLQDPTTAHALSTVFIGLSAIAVPHLFLHEINPKSTIDLQVIR